jgi:CBS domain-containing protein
MSACAEDLMSRAFAALTEDMTVKAAAKVLLERNQRSALVLNADGTPVGVVRDQDLLGRPDDGEPKFWWIELLASEDTTTDRLKAAKERTVGGVMASPPVIVESFATLGEVAKLMREPWAEPLAVVKDGKMIGVLHHVDVIGVIASAADARPDQPQTNTGVQGFFDSLFAGKTRASPARTLEAAEDVKAAKDPGAAEPEASAEAFRALVSKSKQEQASETHAAAQASHEANLRRADSLLNEHVSEERWQALLEEARTAAASGQSGVVMLTFPAALCSDGGRALNIVEEGWDKTLRGEAAEVFARWAEELEPKGFALRPRVAGFEGDRVSEFSLVLTWAR